MNFKDKKITIMGLGLLGGGVEDALFFIKHGAILTITDLREAEELRPSLKKLKKYKNVLYTLGRHDEKDFITADMILKNPGVPNSSPYLKIAKKHNIPVYSSANILFEIADTNKLIGVTGTKGKSSTALLIHEVLKIRDKNAYIAGLPGISLLKHSDRAQNNFGVIELSSWQLESFSFTKKSPHIAVITNIGEDHLDRHSSLDEYIEAKKNIFKYQKVSDYLIIPKELKSLAKDARSKVIFFSPDDIDDAYTSTTHEENAATALKIAGILGIDKKHALEKIQQSKGLPGRLELIAEINGIKIYNDTTATNPFAAMRSIEIFRNKKTALIAGGKDKGLNYKELADKLKNLHFVALLPGTASDKIKKAAGNNLKTYEAKEIKDALENCIASNPEIILFSPAAASFNQFKNEFDRGEKFIEEVNKIKHAKR